MRNARDILERARKLDHDRGTEFHAFPFNAHTSFSIPAARGATLGPRKKMSGQVVGRARQAVNYSLACPRRRTAKHKDSTRVASSDDGGYVNYFEILELDHTAKPGEVRKSFRTKMKNLVGEIAAVEIT